MKLHAICGAFALVLAATAAAQTPPTSEQAKKDMQAQKQDPLALQTSSPEDWNSLKGTEKGYVSKTDAMPNGWLAQNFKNCDKNQDGKVTKEEYEQCKKKQE